jgi:hypothetical protein
MHDPGTAYIIGLFIGFWSGFIVHMLVIKKDKSE